MRHHFGMVKPDPVVNPKDEDGFRRPSGYKPTFSSTLQTDSYPVQQDRYVLPCTIHGEGHEPSSTAGYGFRYRMSGQILASNNGNVNPFPAPQYDYLRTKVLNNVKGEVLDVAMVLAEMQGTTNTLMDGLMRVARSMDNVKRRKPDAYSYLTFGRRLRGRRVTDAFLRDTAGEFLAWKYGVMPTVMDIQGAAKALDMNEDGSLWDNPPLLVGRASIIDDLTRDIETSFRYPGGSGYTEKVPWRVRQELKARIDYTVEGEGLRGLNRYGIGLGTIPTLLFERTPFSFVLNMAIPIADMIKAWTALAGCDVRGYSETLYREISFPAYLAVKPWRGGQAIIEGRPVQKAYWSFARSGGTSVPMPMPFVRNPIKVGNAATVLALFTQLRRPSP